MVHELNLNIYINLLQEHKTIEIKFMIEILTECAKADKILWISTFVKSLRDIWEMNLKYFSFVIGSSFSINSLNFAIISKAVFEKSAPLFKLLKFLI